MSVRENGIRVASKGYVSNTQHQLDVGQITKESNARIDSQSPLFDLQRVKHVWFLLQNEAKATYKAERRQS